MRKKNTGFTLLETLLAIALFSALIIAPLSIASNGLSAAMAGKERITAVALAQDAIEQIRSVRDTNRLTGNAWLTGLNECLTVNGNGCRVDSILSGGGSKILAYNSNPKLNYDSTGGLYGYNLSWPESKFSRVVTITGLDNVSNPIREARVTATVSWQGTFVPKSIVLTEQITNW